ncbi:branched-chain amino acid ABC transporter [Actinomycetaceae bacterium WB03_NA08]|uniref:Branched-chain amino acid ABC transporter n=1 Tax=Scrofimicrobium canadense TaxID=2652290 RepID=A0A6N7VS66_9ACTO|nr:AzlD domain-containing protein [Scrofimicrobium canadense]MSS84627.1 branched-chain amino acid ABC transporter [Scrofimicrobium canadense]
MPSPTYLIVSIVVAASVTWLLRSVPFAMLAPLRRSKILGFLGDHMPLAIMVILVAYTLRDLDVFSPSAVVPAAVALLITATLQLWRSNMILSVLCGTAVYVVMSSLVAAYMR